MLFIDQFVFYISNTIDPFHHPEKCLFKHNLDKHFLQKFLQEAFVVKKVFFQILLGCFFVFFFSLKGFAHCEIPCGIYDDEMRINMISEHIGTVEKSMNEIIKLEKEEHHNSNQLVRWIMNKEHHADEIQQIVTQYFMTQRIKLDTKNYDKKLGLLH